MADYHAGSASVTIRPDLSKFARTLRSELERVRVDEKVDVSPDMDTFAEELKAGLAAINDDVKVEVDADTIAAATKIEALSDTENVTVRVDADTVEAAARIAELSDNERVTIDVDADTIAAEAQITEAARDRDTTIEADADTANAEAHIEAAARRIRASLSEAFNFDGTERRIGAVTGALGSMASTGARIGGLVLAFGALGTAIAGVAGPLGALAVGLAAAGGVFLALPGVIAGAAAGIGTLIIGFQGLTDESADLADSARETVDVVKSFSDEWGDLRKSVQGALFENMAGSLRALGGLLPDVQTGFTGIARAINGGVRGAIASLTTEGAKLDFRAVLDNTTRGFQNMASAGAPLAQVWRDLHTVAAEFFPAMGTSIANASTRFAEFIREARETGQLRGWIEGGIEAARGLGDVFADTGVVIANVFRAATNAGTPFLGFMGEALNRLREWTGSFEGMATMERFFTSTTNALTALLPAVGELGGAIANGLVPWAERLLVALGPGLASGVSALGDAFAALTPSAEPVGALLGQLVDGLGRWAAALAPVVDMILGGLAPALGNVIDPLIRIGEALAGASFSTFSVAVNLAASALEVLAVPLEMVADFMEAQPGLVTAAVAAWTAFKGIPMIMGRLHTSMEPVNKRLGGLTTGLRDARASVRAYTDLNPQVSRMGAAWKTLESTVPAVGRMSQAYRTGASALTPFITRHQEAARHVQMLSISAQTTGRNVGLSMLGMAHNTAAGMGRFAGAVNGVARGAMSGLKTAVGGTVKAMGGFVNALGGPWNIAIMGGLMAVNDLRTGIQQWNEYQAVSRDLANTSATAYKNMFQAIAEGSSQVDAMSGQLSELENNLTRMVENSPNWTQTMFRGMDADVAKKFADMAKSGLDELGMSHEELSQKVMGSEASWNAFKNQLINSGQNQAFAARELQKLRDGYVQASESASKLSPAAMHAADAISKLSNSSDDAATKTERLNIAFMELRGINVSADEAAANLTRTLDSVSSSMESVHGVTLKTNGTINTTTTAGAALYDALNQIGTGMRSSVSAGNDANAVFEQSAGKLEQLRQAAGLGKDEWDALLQKMGMTPKEMEVLAKVNAEPAKAEVAQLQAALADWDGKPTTKTLTIRDEEAKQRIESMGFKISEYDKKTGLAKIDINDRASVDKLNWWVTNGFPQIDMANPTAKVNLDASGLFFTSEYAKFQLSQLDKSRPNPLLNMDVSQFNSKQIKALQDVGLLHGQRPNPKAGMTIRDLTKEQQIALAKVLELGGKKPKPVAYLNKEPLSQGVDTAKNKMGQLQDKTVTVRFQAIYSGFKDSVGTVSRFMGMGNFAGGAWTGERALPKFAHGGYRLPTFGPGTERRDGFLAFDSAGVPSAMLDAGEWIINSRSSAKYNKELAAINAGTFPKLPGYAKGGRHAVKHADEIDKFARGLQGQKYVFGGIHWGDCSAAMSAIARFAVGLAPFAARFTTASERGALAALGFKNGRGGPGDLRMGWKNGGPGGGHTAGTLPNGVNVEMGGANPSMGKYGGKAAGSNDPSFNEHAYLPVPTAYRVSSIEGWNPADFENDMNAALAKNGTQFTAGGTTITQTSGPSGTQEQLPTTISGWAAKLAAPFIQGQVADVLKVLGVSDNPPILQAYQQYMQLQQGQNADGTRTITHVDKEKVAKLEKQIREAKEDLALKEARQKEQRGKVGTNKKGKRTGPSPTTLAAGDLDIRRKKERIRELEKQLAEEKRGYVYNVKKDGTLGGKVKEKVMPAVGAGQTRAGKTPGVLDWPTANGAVDVKYNPKLGAEQWRPVVRVALQRHGLPVAANEDRTVQQIRIESNGNPRIVNRWDSNAKRGTPSGGLLQVIKPTFDAMKKKYATAFRGVKGDHLTPLPNLLAGIGWARHKYGGPSKIWPTRAGYRDGGFVRGPGGKRDDLIPAWLSDMEFVVNAAATAENRGLLEAVNAGVPVSEMVGTALGAARGVMEGAGATDRLVTAHAPVPVPPAAPVAGRGEVHNHFMAANPEEMYRMYRREASRASHGMMGAR
ncbi:hypothetical protein ACKFRT_04290 [Corynebacterium sp. YSMAA1_1_F7]|uniref:hypothetical protein n=1 Tax=Corynebacterium sp. YSMAA1_1_F7 TaxID=3383590 RepID=UPI0038D15A0E